MSPEAIASAISWAKNSLVTADQYVPRANSMVGAIVARIYPEYQQRLVASNACDFDDLLLHVASLLRENSELRSATRRAVPLHPGRRIPGHQSRPVRDRAGPVHRLSEPGGHGRSRPVDLRLARREPEQHPGV